MCASVSVRCVPFSSVGCDGATNAFRFQIENAAAATASQCALLRLSRTYVHEWSPTCPQSCFVHLIALRKCYFYCACTLHIAHCKHSGFPFKFYFKRDNARYGVTVPCQMVRLTPKFPKHGPRATPKIKITAKLLIVFARKRYARSRNWVKCIHLKWHHTGTTETNDAFSHGIIPERQQQHGQQESSGQCIHKFGVGIHRTHARHSSN